MRNIHSFFNKLRLNSGAIWLDEKVIRFSAPKKFQNQETDDFILESKSQISSILNENHIFSKETFLNTKILRDNITTDYPLSFAQERLWFIEEYEQGTNAYHMPWVYELSKDTDAGGISYAIRSIVVRHEVLRSTIVQGEDQQGMQVVHEEPVQIKEVLIHEHEDYEALLREDINRPFDLSREYPIRVIFYHLAGSGRTLLLINTHHIASDGWSTEIFQRELRSYYEAYMRKEESFSLPALAIQYKDYALWQRSYLGGEILNEQLSYWKAKLMGYQTLNLPTDHTRPSQIDYRGRQEVFTLSATTSGKLRALGKRYGVTMHSVLLSGLNILLGKYTGQDDIVTGSPTANRQYRQTEGLIGFFVNTQVNRTLLRKEQSYEELIREVHQEQASAQLHQDLSFEKLVAELELGRDISRHPIFQVMFVVQSFGSKDKDEQSYLAPYRGAVSYAVEKFDLSLFIDDSGEEIRGQMVYATSLFDRETIIRLMGYYTHLLEQLSSAPEQPYSRVSLLNAENHQKLIYDWNNTDKDYPKDKTLHELFAAQAKQTPERIALVYEGQELSYQELDEKSNQLARYIRAAYQQRTQEALKADTLIALCLERSLEMVIGILGVLKAGGAYVPIDAGYPQDRIDYLLADTGTELVLSQHGLDVQLAKDKVVYIDLSEELYQAEEASSLPEYSGPTNLAYVLYTSGTTGRPKGVMVEHRSVIRLVKNTNYISIATTDVFLQLSPYNFDASVLELYGSLLNGAKLVLIRKTLDLTSTIDLFKQCLLDYSVSILWLTKTLFDSLYLLDNHVFDSINYLLVGGEALNKSLIDQLSVQEKRPRHILNGYGPTEGTTFTTTYLCDIKTQASQMSIPIGKGISNTKVYVLDVYGNPVPVGVAGELYIGGAGVARGYLNRAELTAERFISNPFATALDKKKGYTRIYKTGDLVRWLGDGNLEYMGRNDDQVKIRGYRIELGEVEHALSQVAGIRQSCVVIKERETETGLMKYLAGYYVLDGNNLPGNDSVILDSWEDLYDTEYKKAISSEQTESDFTGWNSYIRGEAFPLGEMELWRREILEQIRSLSPGHVLEIGVGTGLLMYPLLSSVHQYTGLDISKAVILRHEAYLKARGQEVNLYHLRADQLEELPSGVLYDTIIVNSVCQYFPGISYFNAMLDQALRRLSPGGAIFIGDIRNYDLQKSLIGEKLGYQGETYTAQEIDRLALKETELLISPGYFEGLAGRYEGMEVRIHERGAMYENELSKYRYDVIILRNGQIKKRDTEVYSANQHNIPFLNQLSKEAIIAQLTGVLPEYMIPGTLTSMESFPLTVNGKLDKQALPDAELGTTGEGYVAPRTKLEERLCKIWGELLNVETVSIDDDFFRIGGDSILAIQLSGRIRKAGFSCQVKDILVCKTIAKLSQHLDEGQGSGVSVQSEQGLLTGAFDLLPVQSWFAGQSGELGAPNHYNQSFLVKVPELEAVKLSTIIGDLTAYHDVLRLRYIKGEHWQQVYQASVAIPALQTLDVRGQSESEIQERLTAWQSGFDLEIGPLFQVGYLHGYEDGSARIYFALHHLVVDGVSWRILTEDIRSLYSGQKLPLKGSSYRQWVERVKAYPGQHPEERDYWASQLSGLPVYSAEASEPSSWTIELSKGDTRSLLQSAPGAYHTEINDLLLTALAYALADLNGNAVQGITLEGHGREDIDSTIDHSHTVGWFTSMYPVRLELGSTIGASIRSIKEGLRDIPSKGLGYGAFAIEKDNSYSHADLPGIVFNYLGQFEGQEEGYWQVLSAPSGLNIHPSNKDRNQISINGLVSEGKLHFSISSQLGESRTKELGLRLKAHLTEIIKHCEQKQALAGPGYTPGDFGTVRLSQGLLDRLTEESHAIGNEVAYIYPANSLQQGFIYHAISQPEDDAYRVQILYDYHQAIDVGKYIRAWEAGIGQYPILRTAFNWEEEVIQVIYTKGQLQYEVHDLSDLETQDARDRAIESIRAEDREQGFDLSQPTLFRLHIIKQAADYYTVIKTEHHITGDGWSGPVLLRSVHGYYQGLLSNKSISIREDQAYPAAQEYIAGNKARINAYWDETLATVDGVNDINSLLSKPIDSNNYRQVEQPAIHTQVIGGSLYKSLKNFSQREGITMNVIVQFLWHKLLQVYSNRDQSIVGTTVSGRDLPVAGIEESVGLYINTLPLVISWATEGTVLSQLRYIQEQTNGLSMHSFADLAKLQKEGRRLFHSLFVFENYPVPKDESESAGQMSIRNYVDGVDYPLSLMSYEHNDSLTIKLQYDGNYLSAEKAEAHLATIRHILEQVLQAPDQPHRGISLLDAESYQEIIYEWNATDKDYPKDKTLHELFAAQAKQTPERIALVYEGQELNYGDLEEKSNQLARHIRARYTARTQSELQPDTLIALCLERSLEMVIGILGVLKAGGAYVPVDPGYPQDRIDYLLEDTGTELVLSQRDLDVELPKDKVVYIDLSEELYRAEEASSLPDYSKATNLAYVIYTSGTTGKPKGVMIEHKSVINFLTGMDDALSLRERDHFLAITSISFDISVLELLGSLIKGMAVTVKSEGEPVIGVNRFSGNAASELDFSLFYFSSQEESVKDKYAFLKQSAIYADKNDFSAIWLPERHFHEFGGIFPNPSVLAAGIATITDKIEIRSGSVVLPLHDTIRVAEEWSVMDNLSNGRIAMSIASGWHTNDFVLQPANYQDRHGIMYRQIEDLKILWQGGSIKRRNGLNEEIDVKIYPRPVREDLNIYITTAGNPETFINAGKIGANILTHLLGQDIRDLEKKIRLYKRSLKDNGFSVQDSKIVLMLHTYIGTDLAEVKAIVKEPFKSYLKSSIGLIQSLAKELDYNISNLAENEIDDLLEFAFERYWESSALLGTVDSCKKLLSSIYEIGVTEIACLVDFGIDNEKVLEGLNYLTVLKEGYGKGKGSYLKESSPITTLQITPSYLDALINDENTTSFLKSLEHIIVGGENFPPELLAKLHTLTDANVYNMYGPTETTIWSTFQKAKKGEALTIGKPIANTQVYVLDTNHNPVPVGVTGELYIGGAGVARGYLNRAELTAERFISNPFATASDIKKGYTRIYKTGDLVRWLSDGNLEYMGRNDDQVKIRGYRIELGEVEHALSQVAGIRQSCVVVKERETESGTIKYLAGYYVAEEERTLSKEAILKDLSEVLPEYMIPGTLTSMESFPLTVNGKLDKQALPDAELGTTGEGYVAPRTKLEERLCKIWGELLNVETVSIDDDFFRIGGDSILAIQLSGRIRKAGFSCQVKDILVCKTIAKLSQHLDEGQGSGVSVQSEQGLLTGAFDLLPVQSWFAGQSGELGAPNHYNQSFLVKVPELEAVKLSTIIGDLTAYHDVLRLRYIKGEHWQQVYQASVAIPALQTLDVRGQSESEIQERLTAWQSGFDLEIGPLFQVGYLHGYEDGSARIYFALHHLVVDGVSWRILTEDIRSLYSGQKLPLKGSSYRQWVERVKAYPGQHPEERDYWASQLSGLPVYSAEASEPSSWTIELSKGDTRSLLQSAPGAYHTEINDLLLTALAYALADLNGNAVQGITLEGHGREDIDSTIDHSHTVGWFTSMYPVRLELGSTIGASIRSIKEGLRDIPSKGLGYGAFAIEKDNSYSHADLPGIIFNYLGQFEGQEEGYWQLVSEGSGRSVHGSNTDQAVININGLVIEGRLGFSISSQLGEARTKELGLRLKAHLTEIIKHCEQKQALAGPGYTPGDFGTVRLSQGLLDRLTEESHAIGNEVAYIYPANSLQQGFIYHAISQPKDNAYRIQFLYDYHQAIDVGKYIRAWEAGIGQYPILRTAFNWEEEVIQVIYTKGQLQYKFHDLSDLQTQDARDRAIESIRAEDREQGFDLSQPTLFRLHIIKQAADYYTVIKTDHHTISDGWSGPVLLTSVHGYYQDLITGRSVNIREDRAYLDAQEYIAANKASINTYWDKTLAEADTANDINALLSRPIKLEDYRQVEQPVILIQVISGEKYQEMKRFSQREGITMNVIVQFLWHKLLQVYSNRDQSIVGTTVSGRDLPVAGIEESVGLYINTLPLVISWATEGTVLSQLRDIQEQTNGLSMHSFADLAKLQKEGRRLFHSLFVFENYPVPKARGKEDQKISLRGTIEKVDYPLCLVAYEHNDTLTIKLHYDGKYLGAEKAEAHLGTLVSILDQVLKSPEGPHRQITLLAPGSYRKIIYDWNATDREYEKDKTIQELFTAQALKIPDQTALVYEGQELNYGELEARSNQLARYIRARYTAKTQSELKPDTLIALCLERSLEMVIGILGVLKAGGAYVPIDPGYPQDRIDYLLEDTEAELVLSQRSVLAREETKLPEDKVVYIDLSEELYREEDGSTLPVYSEPGDLAYVLYTSGTTGKPKGVMLTHSSLCNRVWHMISYSNISSSDFHLFKTNIVFDVSFGELFTHLFVGATVQITQHQFDVDELKELLLNKNFTSVHLVPSQYELVSTTIKSINLEKIYFSGEALTPKILSDIDKDITINNYYGPTELGEITVFTPLDPSEAPVIGKLFPNCRQYVLDIYLNPVPVGVAGELYIGGAGLSRGYLNRAELTAERFIVNPFATEADIKKGYTRIYKTGDLVRWLSDGNLEYLGRNDDQVKIRGYRIELGEVEHALSQVAGIRQSCVVVKERETESGTIKYLAGYYVAEAGTDQLSKEAIIAQLTGVLPEYMIPGTLTSMESFPLTVNGKLDKRLLPDPEFGLSTAGYIAPETELETVLCSIWAELLGLERVGIHDDFFRIGGDSILAIRLSHRLSKALGNNIRVADIFRHRTISQLLEHSLGHVEIAIPVMERKASVLSFAQERLWFIEEYERGTNVYHLPGVYELSKDTDTAGIKYAISSIVSRHEVLRSTIEQGENQRGMQVVHGEPVQIKEVLIHEHDDYEGLLREDINRPFDLSREYPIRVVFYHLAGSGRTLLLINTHHIASDGWSTEIFQRELRSYYEAYMRKEESFSLPALAIQYKDYAIWQRSYLSGEILSEQLSYWKAKLMGYQTLNLPTDHTRPSQIDYRGGQEVFTLSSETSGKLRALGKRYGASLHSVLLSGLNILLGKYTGQDDIVTGSPTANRQYRQTEGLIGFFVNTQVNRTLLRKEQSYEELIREVHQEQASAQLHQDLPFEKLVDELEVERDLSRHPIFQVMFGLLGFGNNSDNQQSYLEPLYLSGAAFAVEKFDLSVFMDDNGEVIRGKWSYAASLFGRETIVRLMDYYTNLLEQLSSAPNQPYSRLSLLTSEVHRKIVYDWNNTDKDYPKDKTLHELFAAQAKQTPERIALVYEGQELNYGELEEKSNQLARHIRARYKARTKAELKPDTLIALCLERSLEMVIGILGVLKAGGAYVPVDPGYPQDRIDYLLEDTGTELVLSQRDLDVELPKDKVVYIDLSEELYRAEEASSLPDYSKATNLAYVIYTSGTTGKPKGVMIEHKSVINFLTGMDDALSLRERDHFLAITSISFDISVLELLGSLIKGMAVTVKSEGEPVIGVNRFSGNAASELDFSLFYFSSQEESVKDKYAFLKQSAIYADKNDFSAIWLPERHFHEFGGIFPNPSVLAAGIATITDKIEIRSGSVVLPLHDTIRVAEEWSVVDNLSNGRIAMSIASGWHTNDFVLQPANYQDRHGIMYRQIEDLKILWQGGSIKRRNGLNEEIDVKIYPRPVREDLNIYITTAGNPETFINAGKIGANILTHLLGQDIRDLEKKIRLYKRSLKDNGFSVQDSKIVLMLHTYIGTDLAEVKAIVKEPFKSYLKSSIGLIQSLAKELDYNISNLAENEIDDLLEFAFERYWESSALLGTVDSCKKLLSSIYEIGVTEIACLVDFGIDNEKVLEGLNYLTVLKEGYGKGKGSYLKESSPITTLQITPSYLDALINDENTTSFLKSLEHIIVGGENFPPELLAKLHTLTDANVYNMYGPTETTIWSTFQKAKKGEALTIGKPIANTQVYVLDTNHNPVPIGVAGELYIGGAGVARGYLNRAELTAERFIVNPFATATDIKKGYTRIYKTGDLVRWLGDGNLEYLGRNDDQVKIRGYRIELGEVEHALSQVAGIRQSCVVVKERETESGTIKYLSGYYVAEIPLSKEAIIAQLSAVLPEYMIPGTLTSMESFPLTVNGKLDKQALPDAELGTTGEDYVEPKTALELTVCGIWAELLGLERVGIHDDFFRIGGNSILAIQLSHRLNKALGSDIRVADIFKLKNINSLLQNIRALDVSDSNIIWKF